MNADIEKNENAKPTTKIFEEKTFKDGKGRTVRQMTEYNNSEFDGQKINIWVPEVHYAGCGPVKYATGNPAQPYVLKVVEFNYDDSVMSVAQAFEMFDDCLRNELRRRDEAAEKAQQEQRTKVVPATSIPQAGHQFKFVGGK